MIYYKTHDEIECIRQSSLLVSRTLAEVGKHIRPGISTLELDKIVEEYIRSHGGIPAFLGYRGFPNSACISVNEVVVHGIPGQQVLKEGDIVSVDCGAILDGFVGDSAYTFPVGEVTTDKQRLLKVTRESLGSGCAAGTGGKEDR
jgi:methionyl aminopeptidase